MPMQTPFLSDQEPVLVIDVPRLVATRLLVQANSGGGKSWALRRILEQTFGHVQHLVLDPDGEYHTLREKYDYVLAGKGGDCPAEVKSAALLARRLLELGVSAIIDISELGADRALFVERFIEALMDAPRDLWHDVLVVIDEAHKFAPEGDRKATAHAAVVDLMSRGRKRGFCGVLATQRVSKLDKSAAAEVNNKLIGRTGLDVDVERAAKEIGLHAKDARQQLARLQPGEFWVVGPAFGTAMPVLAKVGDVETTHPDTGASRSGPPTPPRAHVKKMLGQLSDLPAEAEEEAKSVEQLRSKVRELEKQLRSAEAREAGDIAIITDVERERDEVIKACIATMTEAVTHAERVLAKQDEDVSAHHQAYSTAMNQYTMTSKTVVSAATAACDDLRNMLAKFSLIGRMPPLATARTVGKPDRRSDTRRQHDKTERAVAAANGHRGEKFKAFVEKMPPLPTGLMAMSADNGLSKMETAMLTALAQHPDGLTKPKLLLHADYSAGGATSKCFAKMQHEAWVSPANGGLRITPAGLQTLGHYTPLPVGAELRKHVLSGTRLSPMEKKLLGVICDSHPYGMPKHEILDRAGYSAGGATSKAFARLVALDYAVAAGRGELAAAEELFG